jgi:spore maturation protein CgeB
MTGARFHDFNSMFARAFNEFGCEVKISDWPDLCDTFFERAKLLLYEKTSTRDDLLDKSEIVYSISKDKITDYNNSLLQEVAEVKPDVLLVLKGDILLPETIKKIRDDQNVILVIWCYDTAMRFSNVLSGGQYYHLFYTYEPTDIPNLQKYGIHAKFLPMAYDPHTYFKLEDESVVRDICFVGLLNVDPERKKILGKIVSHYGKLKVDIWGQAWTKRNPFLLYEYKIKRRALGKHIHNYNIHPKEVNKIYNSTKMCLNIQHYQVKEGINPRTFEIMGAGGFQLVSYKKNLGELFDTEKEIIYYKDEADLLEKIGYYLENDDERRKIAERGMEAVKRKHTFKHRAETILADIKEIR